MTDAENAYMACKWLSEKKKQTRAAEMPPELVDEFRLLFGGGVTNAPNAPKEHVSSIWRDIKG